MTFLPAAVLLLFVLTLAAVVVALARASRATPRRAEGAASAPERAVAVLVASRNGEQTLGETLRSVAGQGDLYVVSDASTDRTADVARAAGAHVLELETNVGKPAAIYRLIRELELTQRYDAIAILDDDTIVAPDFVAEAVKAMRPGVGIVVGRTISRWDRRHRWNVWIGSRAYSYWRYQATLRRGQSALNVMNCISGSNSLYRSDVLDRVLVEQTPYIVDDTYWTLETHRRGLGRIVYAPQAKAWICDPASFRDWYRQNVRWIWGTLQGVRGHRLGTQRTLFDACSLLLVLDWILYVTAFPVILLLAVWLSWASPVWVLAAYGVGVLAWTSAATVAMGKWRLVLMTPAIIVIDWIYRAIFAHAFVKTLLQPQVASCRWDSPARY